MKISANMFYSAFINQQKREKFLKKIYKHKNISNLYLMIYRANNINLLEIISTKELYRLDKREADVYVLGMVQSLEEAYDWIGKLALRTHEHFQEINKETLFKELECDAKIDA